MEVIRLEVLRDKPAACVGFFWYRHSFEMPLVITTKSIANAIKARAERETAVHPQLEHAPCSLIQSQLLPSEGIRLPLPLKEGVHKHCLPVDPELVSCFLNKLKLLALAKR